jgi:hypothetical protein
MSTLDWLLDSDPSIHWQTLQDLTNAPDEDFGGQPYWRPRDHAG